MENIMGILGCLQKAFAELKGLDTSTIKHPAFARMVDLILNALNEKDLDASTFVTAMRKVKIWQHRCGTIIIDLSEAEESCHKLLHKTFEPIMERHNSIYVYCFFTGKVTPQQIEMMSAGYNKASLRSPRIAA